MRANADGLFPLPAGEQLMLADGQLGSFCATWRAGALKVDLE